MIRFTKVGTFLVLNVLLVNVLLKLIGNSTQRLILQLSRRHQVRLFIQGRVVRVRVAGRNHFGRVRIFVAKVHMMSCGRVPQNTRRCEFCISNARREDGGRASVRAISLQKLRNIVRHTRAL